MLRNLGTKAKVGIVLAVLISAGFIMAAVVTYAREGDWPAKYFSAAAMTLLFVMMALKRRARRDRRDD